MDGFAPHDQDYNPQDRSRPLPAVLKQYGSTSRKNTTSQPNGMVNPQAESLWHLAGLVNNQGGDFEQYRKTEDELKSIKNKGVREFYRTQNLTLDFFKEIDETLDSSAEQARSHSVERRARWGNGEEASETDELLPRPVTDTGNRRSEKEEKEGKDVRWTIVVNLIINVLLLAGKVVVALLSNSISLIASLIDSFMDLMSTVIIGWTNRAMDNKDAMSVWFYPTGKRRMEPMGIVIFSVFMITSFTQVLVESIQRLFNPTLEPAVIPFPAVIVMVSTIIVKSVVWLWCRGKKNSSVKALAQDAENDCVFNFFSLLFPYVGQKLNLRWLDALGGILLSIYIIYEWSDTLIEHVRNLTGRRASPKQHQRVAYLVTRFSPLIQALQHCNVHRAGDDYVVEVDVILPPETPLTVAHDVGESVQYALESLEGVVRAYCHVDVRANQLSGHFQR